MGIAHSRDQLSKNYLPIISKFSLAMLIDLRDRSISSSMDIPRFRITANIPTIELILSTKHVSELLQITSALLKVSPFQTYNSQTTNIHAHEQKQQQAQQQTQTQQTKSQQQQPPQKIDYIVDDAQLRRKKHIHSDVLDFDFSIVFSIACLKLSLLHHSSQRPYLNFEITDSSIGISKSSLKFGMQLSINNLSLIENVLFAQKEGIEKKKKTKFTFCMFHFQHLDSNGKHEEQRKLIYNQQRFLHARLSFIQPMSEEYKNIDCETFISFGPLIVDIYQKSLSHLICFVFHSTKTISDDLLRFFPKQPSVIHDHSSHSTETQQTQEKEKKKSTNTAADQFSVRILRVTDTLFPFLNYETKEKRSSLNNSVSLRIVFSFNELQINLLNSWTDKLCSLGKEKTKKK